MPFEDLKARQSVMWSSGAYEPIVEITSEIHEALVAALDGQPGQPLAGHRDRHRGGGPARGPNRRRGHRIDLAPA